jgi:imidazolonepropionase-like amidohydrolase
MKLNTFHRFAAALALTAAAHAGDSYAVKAGTVITMAGDPIENGVIVMQDGRITAVGKDGEVEIPWDAEVFEAPGLVAFPGMVETCISGGMDRPNESVDVTPFLDVNDSIDPVNFFYEDMRRAGVTTLNIQQGDETVVAGRGMTVKPYGMTVEAMMVRPQSGIKISVAPKRGKSRAVQLMILRNAFADLRRALEGMVEEKQDEVATARREALAQGREFEEPKAPGRAMEGSGWKVEGLEWVDRATIDEKLSPLLDVVEGRLPVYLNCESPMDVLHGLAIARENGFLAQTVLMIGPSCWKVSDQIKEAGVRGVVLPLQLEHTEREPFAEEDTVTLLPKHFAEKGISFALRSANSTTEALWYQAARCVALGVDRQQALESITTMPADLIGLGGDVGSLEPGHHANIVLLDGDPLSLQSSVQFVIIEGRMVYDRSQDTRLQHLLDGVEPEGVSADEPVVTDIHEEERKAGGE